MGTSTSYSPGVSGQPQWGDLSSSVTRNCHGGEISNENKSRILGNFVRVAGGAKNAGRGGSKVFGRSGIRTSKNLGFFLGDFSTSGGNLRHALDSTGLSDIEGKSVEDIINHLIEYCSGVASTIDDIAAKEASRKMIEELFSGSESIEEAQQKLREQINTEAIEDIIVRYFGHYILEHLSVMFYEKLVREKGKSDCSNLFQQIEDYIMDCLIGMNKNNPLNNVDWSSSEADRLINNIQEDVLTIFEDYEN